MHTIYNTSEDGIRNKNGWGPFIYVVSLLIGKEEEIIYKLWHKIVNKLTGLLNGLTQEKGLGNALRLSIIFAIVLVHINNSYFPILGLQESTKVFDGITTMLLLTPAWDWYLKRREKRKEA